MRKASIKQKRNTLRDDLNKLAAVGIKSMTDLDAWIKANPRVDKWGNRFLHSRYGAIKELAGERAAGNIIETLAQKVCF